MNNSQDPRWNYYQDRPGREDKQDVDHPQLRPPAVSGSVYEVYSPVGFWETATFRQSAVIIVGVLYCLSPVDFIPEAFLGPLGLLDDAGTVAVVIATIKNVLGRRDEIRRYRERRALGGY